MDKIKDYTFLEKDFNSIRIESTRTPKEARQISRGIKTIKLSKTHFQLPFLNKATRAKVLYKSRNSNRGKGVTHFIPDKFSFFEMQCSIIILLNQNPNLEAWNPNRTQIGNACLYLYLRDYIGNYNSIHEDYKIVLGVLQREFGLLKKYSYYGYYALKKSIYPSVFVGNKATFKTVRFDQTIMEHLGKDVRKSDITRKERTNYIRAIFVRFIGKLKARNINKYVAYNGMMKKAMFNELNRILLQEGFKAYEKSAMYRRIAEALELLGVTMKELWESVKSKMQSFSLQDIMYRIKSTDMAILVSYIFDIFEADPDIPIYDYGLLE